MSQDDHKRAAAQAALDRIRPRLERDAVVGIGTGSTTNFFIDLLADCRDEFAGAVASSNASAQRLESHGIEVLDLNVVGPIAWYVDGADEANEHLELIKGGGGALTREKIVAQAAREFICIADQSKLVSRLGTFPLPVEVIPMARSLVARELVALGGDPVYRQGVVTDNGNIILDIHHLDLSVARQMEERINQIPGVVCNGLFALRPADVLILAGSGGVDIRPAS